MRIVVVGAGALGGLIGAQLTESGEDVTLIEINQARVKLLKETGLFISAGTAGERCVRVKVVSSPDGLGQVDLVFISVKSYQTEAAVRNIIDLVGPKTKVLSMQNGVGNAEVMAEILGPERIVCGITYHSIQHTGPNRLRYKVGIKPIQIAPLDGRITPEIEAIGQVFRKAGFNTNVLESIDHAVWQKLLHNATVNPVSALTALTCRAILDDESLLEFMRALCLEIVAVMRARGVPIVDEEDPFRPVMGSLRALGKNRPSMWQDLARGYRTEIDALNGAIVEEAERLGLEAPLNFGLVRFIKSRERQVLRLRERSTKTLDDARQSQLRLVARPMDSAQEGGMPQGRVPLECAPRLRELLGEYYADLGEAERDPARRVAWCSGLGPVEVLRALGMTVHFPENHAALIGAGRQAPRFIRRALAEGFSPFVSTEMTSDIGATLAGESPLVTVHDIAGPPRPDVLAYSTNYANHLLHWFEFYGQKFNAPLFGLHPPMGINQTDQVIVDASTQRILNLIDGLEAVLGTKMDYDRLAEVVDLSARAASHWAQILDLAQKVPSPLTFFDLLVHLAPMVLMRGTPQALEYYRVLYAELEQRVENGVAAVPGERFRVYWEGPPIWSALRALSTLFMEHEVAAVSGSFTRIFALEGLDTDNPVESMARCYISIFPNRSSDFKLDYLRKEYEANGVDAVVYHDGRTCPEHSSVRYGLHNKLGRITGLPYLVLEADTHDQRLFCMDELERQLRDFIDQADRQGGSRA